MPITLLQCHPLVSENIALKNGICQCWGKWKTGPTSTCRSASTAKIKHFLRVTPWGSPLAHACQVLSMSITAIVSYPAHRQNEWQNEQWHNSASRGGVITAHLQRICLTIREQIILRSAAVCDDHTTASRMLPSGNRRRSAFSFQKLWNSSAYEYNSKNHDKVQLSSN